MTSRAVSKSACSSCFNSSFCTCKIFTRSSSPSLVTSTATSTHDAKVVAACTSPAASTGSLVLASAAVAAEAAAHLGPHNTLQVPVLPYRSCYCLIPGMPRRVAALHGCKPYNRPSEAILLSYFRSLSCSGPDTIEGSVSASSRVNLKHQATIITSSCSLLIILSTQTDTLRAHQFLICYCRVMVQPTWLRVGGGSSQTPSLQPFPHSCRNDGSELESTGLMGGPWHGLVSPTRDAQGGAAKSCSNGRCTVDTDHLFKA